MTLTNRMNLPDGIVQAVTNDPYNRGSSDISVTQLIQPPYQRKLRETVEQIEDVSDRIWSLIGQSVHTILERAYKGKGLVEERLYTDVLGWKVSGQFDVIENGCLMDYKVTSVWAIKGDTKIEWEQQLNLLRLLAHENGIEVTSMKIIAILRDWSKGKANGPDYPEVQVVPIDIQMWTLEQTREYMLERVKLHQQSEPQPCTAVERWQTQNVYAVMKDGRKSAVTLHYSPAEAREQCFELGKGHTVVHRPGSYRRCAGYCNVSHGCPEFQAGLAF